MRRVDQSNKTFSSLTSTNSSKYFVFVCMGRPRTIDSHNSNSNCTGEETQVYRVGTMSKYPYSSPIRSPHVIVPWDWILELEFNIRPCYRTLNPKLPYPFPVTVPWLDCPLAPSSVTYASLQTSLRASTYLTLNL